MNKNFNRLMDQMNGIKSDDNPNGTDLNEPLNWHSNKWPTMAPDFDPEAASSATISGPDAGRNKRARTNEEREGYRHAKIMISNQPTSDYPHSSSGEFICESSPPNSWGFLPDTSENYKIYHNMATGWSPNAGADNRTDSIIIQDRYGEWFNIHKNLTDPIYNGLSINSTRSWSEYVSTRENPSYNPITKTTNQISEDSIVTYPNEIKSITDFNLTLKAVPSGKAAGEAEFGSSQVYKLFDFYYGMTHSEAYLGGPSSKARPWLPYATIPPYIRTSVPEDVNSTAGLNGSPDILQGTFEYTDADNNIKTISWETNFAHAFVPLKRSASLPKHHYSARNKDSAPNPHDGLAADGSEDQQSLIVHTNIALLHISVPK
jgi:hypothetical protein